MNEKDWRDVRKAFELVHDAVLEDDSTMEIKKDGVWRVYSVMHGPTAKDKRVLIEIGVG